jgi:pyrroloquinoline quinone biosynthesis protein D
MSDALPLRLSSCVRMRWDGARNAHVLLVPEAVVVLNPTAAEVLSLCDGTRTLDAIVSALTARYNAPALESDVRGLVSRLRDRGWLVDGDTA